MRRRVQAIYLPVAFQLYGVTTHELLARSRAVLIFTNEVDPAGNVTVFADDICSVSLHLALWSVPPSRRAL